SASCWRSRRRASSASSGSGASRSRRRRSWRCSKLIETRPAAAVGDRLSGFVAVDPLPHSLYVHIPFCVSKCPYCDFNSHVGLDHLFGSYNRALVAEIERLGAELHGPRLDTIFIGGGTPSRVPGSHIGAVMGAVRDSFDVPGGA